MEVCKHNTHTHTHRTHIELQQCLCLLMRARLSRTGTLSLAYQMCGAVINNNHRAIEEGDTKGIERETN